MRGLNQRRIWVKLAAFVAVLVLLGVGSLAYLVYEIAGDAPRLRGQLLALGGSVLLATVLLGVAGSYWLARGLGRALDQLAEQSARLAEGDFDARVEESSGDDLGALQRAFNHMAEQLAASYSRLEQRMRQRTGELEYERYLLHTLLDNLPDIIYFKDVEARFVRLSRELARRLGLDDPQQAIGKSDAEFFPEEYAQKALADELELMRSGEPIVGKEEHPRWPDDSQSWVSTTKSVLRDENGQVTGTLGISHDISAQKQAQEAAEAANQAKSAFLATMSHEMRTPLHGILGMTDLVLGMPLTDEQRGYLQLVYQSGESLLAIIDDVLDFSKIEADVIDLDHAPFDLYEMVGDTMQTLAPTAHGKGLELSFHIDPSAPQFVCGDRGRLRQVLVNLVGNAVKFTDTGEVVLAAECKGLERGGHEWRFAVRDTGIGVPPELGEKIFDAFQQADGSLTRKFGGSGLGLAISQRLVTRMEGRIWLEDNDGPGSTFHFTVQLSAATDEQIEQIATRKALGAIASLEGLRVLIVDDNATNRGILQDIVTSWRMSPTAVSSAREAMQALHAAHRNNHPYELVLTDCNMPDVDGFTLSGWIKNDRELGSSVILMLTSADRPGDLTRCRDLGIASYLRKPVKQSDLFDAIVAALCVVPAEDESAARQFAPAKRRLRILLAEDSKVNQKLAIGLLTKRGHEVVVANNGREAVAMSAEGRYDVVLMDVQMPEMDGLQATQAIRQREAANGGRLPIVAMTAHAMKSDRQRCLDAGMDEYVTKPIRAGELFATIERLVTRPGVLGQADAPPDAVDEQPASKATSLIDWSTALSAVGGDRELLGQVIRVFLDDYPQRLEQIRQGIAENDFELVQRAAHTIKGNLRHFGADQTAETALRIEEMGESKDLQGASEALQELEEALTRLRPLLEEGCAGGEWS